MGEEEQGESHFKSMQRGGYRRKEDYEIFLINKKYCMYKLCAIIHRVHKFSREEDHAASEKLERSSQMAFEKKTTHATWTQPPPMCL